MGKNFSTNNLGQRKKSDFYETPYSVTQQLLDTECFEGLILEPAQGEGAIVSILNKNHLPCVGYDIEKNFLTETQKYPNIITNPPFSIALEFILKAKEIAEHKIAFLLPLAYLHGKRRYDVIYQDKLFPLETVHVFTRYPMLGDKLREDGKYRTGMMVYAWFVWNREHSGSPKISWIDNNNFVLNKNDI